MNTVITVVLLAVVGCFILGILKKYASDFILPATICLGIIILLFALGFFEQIKEIFDLLKNNGLEENWLESVVKISLICFVGQLGCGICTDLGEKNISDKIETVVKVTVIVMCIPYIKELFEMVKMLE